MESSEMINKIIEKRLKRCLLNKENFTGEANLPTKNDFNIAKAHGTTILALKYNKGVIIAADRRCVAGETIFSDKMVKIEEIGTLSCLAGAGWVSDFQWLTDILREEFIPNFEKFWDTEIFVDGQAKLLKYIMRNILLFTWPILAGFDPFQKTGRIFLQEPGGAIFEFDDYVSCGSGENGAKGILEKEWSKNCSETKGIRIAIEALLAASDFDRNTSPSSIFLPLVKVITSEKISDVSSEKAYQIAWGIVAKKEARKGTEGGVGKFIVKTFLQKNSETEEKKRSKGDKKNDNPKP